MDSPLRMFASVDADHTSKTPALAAAHDELGKFLALAASFDYVPWMFSRFIGDVWCQLSETPGYEGFCLRYAGAPVRYDQPSQGGMTTWLDAYHDRFGVLPAIWFADERGQVDVVAYARYVDTRTIEPSVTDRGRTGSAGDETVDMPASVLELLEQVGVARSQPVVVRDRPGRRLWKVHFTGQATAGVGGKSKTSSQRVPVGPSKTVYVKQFQTAEPFRREATALSQAPAGAAPALLAAIPEDYCVVMAGADGRTIDQAPPGREADWMAAGLRSVSACSGLLGPWDPDSPTVLTATQESIAKDLTITAPSAQAGLWDCLASPDAVACHGDISPSNVLVSEAGQATLIDFEFYGPGLLVADFAALVLTPSLPVPFPTRIDLLMHSLIRARQLGCATDRNRVAGAIVLWAVQCASWYQARTDLDDDAAQLAEATISLSRQALSSLYEGVHR
jgi:hypothetical protein